MNRRGWRVVRWAFGLVILVVAGRSVLANWSRLAAQPVEWRVTPVLIAASLLVTWAMYAVLIQAWRVMLTGWGQALAPLPAARIWTVSSLGKYVPGQVWAIAGMAVMAQRAGVAPWAATSSSVLLQGLAVGTGACVLGFTGVTLLETGYPNVRLVLLALMLLSGLGVALLMWPPFVRRLLGLLKVELGGGGVPAFGKVLFGAVANVLAWLGYGVALWLLSRGLFASAGLSVPQAIGAFTASYLAGFLAFGVPDGLVVRETVFVSMVQGTIGAPTALALALASRILLTFAQFGAAAPFNLSSPERTRAQS